MRSRKSQVDMSIFPVFSAITLILIGMVTAFAPVDGLNQGQYEINLTAETDVSEIEMVTKDSNCVTPNVIASNTTINGEASLQATLNVSQEVAFCVGQEKTDSFEKRDFEKVAYFPDQYGDSIKVSENLSLTDISLERVK